MKRLLIAVAYLCAAAALTACDTTGPLVKYKYIGDEAPDALLQDCTVSAPPAREQYRSSTAEQKEALLSKSLQGTYKDLTECNADKASLRAWKAKQAELKAKNEAKPAQ